MRKGEVKCNFLAKPIPDLIQVLHFEERHCGPFLNPFLVESMIVQWEQGLHVLPSTMYWGDASISFFHWARDQMVDCTVTFSFCQRLVCQGIVRFTIRLSGPYAVEPVLYSRSSVKDALRHLESRCAPRAVDGVVQTLIGSHFDKD